MKRIFVFILLLFSQYQVIYSIDNIYEDAMIHFVEEIVETREFEIRESGDDSLYNHTLIFETDAADMRSKLPQTIHSYRIINFGIPELQCYLDTVPDGIIRFFFINQMDYGQKRTAPFFISFVDVMVKKTNSVLYFRRMTGHDFCYKYNCETNTLEYKYYVSGNLEGADAFDYLRGKGLRGIYSNIAFY